MRSRPRGGSHHPSRPAAIVVGLRDGHAMTDFARVGRRAARRQGRRRRRRSPYDAGRMPELPEVEITARRLDEALRGAEVQSVLAPGVNALKTFDPPLETLVGRKLEGVRRRGKHFVVDVEGDLALLIHLMSAGRLQLFDKLAGPRDRTSRLLVRLADGRELRLREFGTKQAAWVKLLTRDGLEQDDALATLGPEAWPDPPPLDTVLDAARPLHPLLRDQRVIAGIGRSWVDEILWASRLSPFKRGDDLDDDERAALRDGDRPDARRRARALRADRAAADPGQAADAVADPPPRGRAMPALWNDAGRSAFRGLRDRLLSALPDGRPRPEGPPPLAPAEVGAATCPRPGRASIPPTRKDRRHDRAGRAGSRLQLPDQSGETVACPPCADGRSSCTSTRRRTRPAARLRPAAYATIAPTTRARARRCSACPPTP